AVYSKQAGDRKVVLKVLLPQSDAKVKVDGKTVKGKGESRTINHKVAADQQSIVVTAMWEPNNYTKITRKRIVSGRVAEVELDFTKKDPNQPDDIVVRYVPTPDDVVEAMCKMAKVSKNDIVYDLGCGDGRMVITAVKKFNAKRGVGVDIDSKLVEECKQNA